MAGSTHAASEGEVLDDLAGKVYGTLEFVTFIIIGSRSMLLLLFSICSHLHIEDIVMAT
jgi:hypothetical protein